MNDPSDFAVACERIDPKVSAVVDRALEDNRRVLHERLVAWIQLHPNGADPTVHLAPEDGDPPVGRILPHAEALEFFQTSTNPVLQAVGRTLCRLPPVPLGSIDVIVSTPRLVALVRATPSLERAS